MAKVVTRKKILIASYMDCNIIEDETKRQKDAFENNRDCFYYEDALEYDDDNNLVWDESKVRDAICKHPEETFSDAWDCMLEDLGAEMKTMHDGTIWAVKISNFGWRGIDGYGFIDVADAKAFLGAILPKTDCNFKIYREGRYIKIQNWHHDSPIGNEWYAVVPVPGVLVCDDCHQNEMELNHFEKSYLDYCCSNCGAEITYTENFMDALETKQLEFKFEEQDA